MRVLLIQSFLRRGEPPVMPLGLAYLAAVVPEHEVEVLDLNLEDAPYVKLAERVAQFAPEVAAVSLRNIDNQDPGGWFCYYEELPKAVRTIRAARSQTRIIVGGSGFSMFPSTIMERNPEIGYGVLLEGEEVFPQLLRKLETPWEVPNVFYRKEGRVEFSYRGPLPDLRALPIPRKDLLRMEVYRSRLSAVGVQSRRGCLCNCAYCNYPSLNGDRVRMRNPVQVADEIEELVRRYQVTEFAFADAIFSSPFDYVQAICREIRQRNLTVRWGAWCNVPDITEDFLREATSAGCEFIMILPDAYSPTALEALRKGFTPADVRRAIRLLLRWPGIQFAFSFFLRPPGETVGGFLRTLAYFVRVSTACYLWRKGRGGFGYIRIEPNTRVHEIAMQEGLVSLDTDLLTGQGNDRGRIFYVNPRLKSLDHLTRGLMWVINLRRFLPERRPSFEQKTPPSAASGEIKDGNETGIIA